MLAFLAALSLMQAPPATGRPDAGTAGSKPATCQRPWRTGVTALTELHADATGVVLCAATQAFPGEVVPLPLPCARVDFASGAFTDVARPAAAAAASPQPAVEGLRVCVGPKCVALLVPEKDARELAAQELPLEFNESHTLAAVPLVAQRAVGLFDVATGRLVSSLKVPSDCPARAFFLGDAVYVVATHCKDPEAPTASWLFNGPRRTATRKVLGFADLMQPVAAVHLRDDVWAVASHKPARVTAVRTSTGAALWSVAVPQLDEREGAPLGLGLTPFGTAPTDCSTIAATPSGAVVAVSATGVALIDGSGKAPRFWPFPDCGPPEP